MNLEVPSNLIFIDDAVIFFPRPGTHFGLKSEILGLTEVIRFARRFLNHFFVAGDIQEIIL